MIIVLEGPDGTGKSTLGYQLAKDLNAQYYHSGGPKTLKELEDKMSELEIMAESSRYYIVDRVPYISEMVYGYALRGSSLITASQHQRYKSLAKLYIFCKPSAKHNVQMSLDFKAHKPKIHTDLVIKNKDKIKDLYDSIFKKIPHTIYNMDNYKEVLQKCVDL